jgi:hypothetical protein
MPDDVRVKPSLSNVNLQFFKLISGLLDDVGC